MARFINYLLVPIQTAKFTAAGGQYGIITNVYAYVALLIIILLIKPNGLFGEKLKEKV